MTDQLDPRPPKLVEVYRRATVALNLKLFAADATVKSRFGYTAVDVRTVGDDMVVTYQLRPPPGDGAAADR